MNKKQLLDYESPTTQLIDLRVESGILITSDPQNNPNSGYDNGWDLGDI